VSPAPAPAQREPVLKQVDVPHAYYWREMYIPQATSGPSAVAWAPDGTALIYSMQGWLWRQPIGSPVAEQLTTGAGYDYQPDWSSDGRAVAFARYANDATGGFWGLAARPGAVPREVRYEETTWRARPDWAPDGQRIVYSSYLGGQWHQLWLMTSEGGDPFPITYGDFDATAPRWSHDGK